MPQIEPVPCSMQGCILPGTFLNPHQSRCEVFVVSYEPPLSFLLWGKTPLSFSKNFWYPRSVHSIRLHLGSVYMPVKSLQSCLTLCDPMDRSPPRSSVHEILQARILKWVAIPFSRASSWPDFHLTEPAFLRSPELAGGSLPLAPPGEPHLGSGSES